MENFFDNLIAEMQDKTEEQQTEIKKSYAENLSNKFDWNITKIFERLLNKYKDQFILVEWTKNAFKWLQELKKSRENKLDTMKKNLDYLMKNFWLDKIDTNNWQIKYWTSHPLEIIDENLVPEDYKEIIETVSIDKMAIKKALKEWKEVDWVELLTKKNINIK